MKVKLAEIQAFTSNSHIAVAGVSANTKKFGNEVFRHLLKLGYIVYPVNPRLDEVEGVKCYRSISDLPAEVTALHINTKPVQSPQLVRQAYEKGIMHVWMQQGAGHPDAIAFAGEKGMNAISGKCIFMFTGELSGPHKFHAFIKKLFGTFPR
jgi:uncharacterized protein